MKGQKNQPSINVLTRVKKKGSQEKQLEAEVVLVKVKMSSSSISNLFSSMVSNCPQLSGDKKAAVDNTAAAVDRLTFLINFPSPVQIIC